MDYQPIPSNYYNFLNDDNNDYNNIFGTPIDDALPDNKVVEYVVVPNYEYINNGIIFDDYDRLSSYIEPLHNKILVIVGVDNETEGRKI